MPPPDATRLFAALLLLVTALFLVAGRVGGRFGPPMRWLAITGYAVAMMLAIVEVWRWLVG